MADYVIQGVPNQDGNLLSTPIVDVSGNSNFKVQEVTDKDGKKIAVPVVQVGALSSGTLVPPSVIMSGTTSTAAATAIKIVDGIQSDYVPKSGDFLVLKFTVASTVASPQVSINGTSYYLRWNNNNLTSSANYSFAANQTIFVRFDGTAYQFVHLPDWSDNDTIPNTNMGGNNFIAGVQITRYKLCMKGIDGKLYPLSIGDVTTATKTASTQIFDLSSPVLFWTGSGSIAAGAKATNGFYYEYYYSSGNIQYSFNGFASADFNKQLYLVGTITGGGFKLDQTSVTSWYTTVIPTSANGKVYLPIGYVGDNANVFNLMNTGTYMQYKSSVFAPVGFYGL
ncbi:MAG: hypothetical protein LBI78_07350 [Campylobacteraceae bacterium]|jgi:hypothetical protein|nr:hypothetical protein [Campylobacteraceae bacterium]